MTGVFPPSGLSRVSGQQPVGGLIRRFLEECLQLPAPGPLLTAYTGLEGTPHFQLLRSVAKEWSYCRNATQNYTSMGGKSKRQRATSRLIETFENIDSLRSQLSLLKHKILIMEVDSPGSLKRICRAEAAAARKLREQQQGGEASGTSGAEHFTPEELDCKDIKSSDRDLFEGATEVMKQLRKLYFDQSRRLAVRISQLKKGRQATQERMQRQQSQMQQQNYVQQQSIQQQQQHHHQQQQQQQQQHHLQQQQQQHHTLQQQQQQQQMMQQQLQLAQEGVMLPHQLSLHHLHQPWSD